MESSLLEKIFKKPFLLGFLVKELDRELKGVNFGKTLIQKIGYIFSREENGVSDFTFSLYHYGPYSFELNSELDFAEGKNFINIEWTDKGYVIKPTKENITKYEEAITREEKEKIEEVVKKYGHYSVVEISIIATAYFLLDRFKTPKEELTRAILNLKPTLKEETICEALKKEKILS
jgi:hypothetical protein